MTRIKKEETEAFELCSVFSGCRPGFAASLLDPEAVRTARPGELILRCGGQADERRCLILLSGSAVVRPSDSQKGLIMRLAGPGDILGLASLFSAGGAGTDVFAAGERTAKFIAFGRDELMTAVSSDITRHMGENIIRILSEKVSFLSGRIAEVTGGSALQKFCCYLRSSASPDGRVNIGMSMTSLASALDIGRASLYRCVDTLVADGVIERRDGGFSIARPEYINKIIYGAD